MQGDGRGLVETPSPLAGDSVVARRADDARFDRAIIRRIVDRDVSAIEEAYARYGRPIWSLARKITADDGVAEEVVQEAFLRLWTRASDYDPTRGRLLPWLLTIAHHRAIDELRRRRARGEVGGIEAALGTAEALDGDPADYAAAADDSAAVIAALASLPEAQRRAIELAYYGGYSQMEIAARTGEPLGTIKTRIRLALRKLRDLLGDRRETAPDEP